MDELRNINMVLVSVSCTVTYGWCLFELIALSKADFNCCNSFTLSWVDRLTTGT